jgi:hypothetical protein
MSTLVWMLFLGVLVGFFGAFVTRLAARPDGGPWRVVLILLAVAVIAAAVWYGFMVLGVGPAAAAA